MVAVSQAPSPESNPNSPLPVTAMVVHYAAITADRADSHADKRHRSMRYYSIDLIHPITAAIAGVGFCFGQLHPAQPPEQAPEVESVRVLLTCISFGVTKVIQ